MMSAAGGKVPGNGGRGARLVDMTIPEEAGSSFGRDLEHRLLQTPIGAMLSQALSEHRDAAVALLTDGDGRRAAEALVTPLLHGSVTTDDVLNHSLDEDDVRNAERLLTVVARLRPEVAELVGHARRLLADAAGRTVHELLTSGKLAVADLPSDVSDER
jgi:hypothetical protein